MYSIIYAGNQRDMAIAGLYGAVPKTTWFSISCFLFSISVFCLFSISVFCLFSISVFCLFSISVFCLFSISVFCLFSISVFCLFSISVFCFNFLFSVFNFCFLFQFPVFNFCFLFSISCFLSQFPVFLCTILSILCSLIRVAENELLLPVFGEDIFFYFFFFFFLLKVSFLVRKISCFFPFKSVAWSNFFLSFSAFFDLLCQYNFVYKIAAAFCWYN